MLAFPQTPARSRARLYEFAVATSVPLADYFASGSITPMHEGGLIADPDLAVNAIFCTDARASPSETDKRWSRRWRFSASGRDRRRAGEVGAGMTAKPDWQERADPLVDGKVFQSGLLGRWE